MLFDAIEFATTAHRGQYRKASNEPYIVHPLGVMRILLSANVDEVLASAGVLHDVVEDTPVTVDQLGERFGSEVVRLVLAASEPDKNLEWEDRKKHTIEFLSDQARPDEVLLTLADKLDNTESMAHDYGELGEGLWGRFKRGKEQQAWYYGRLLDVFHKRVDHAAGQKLVQRMETALRLLFRA
jgi:(p)ppGpp synthase/HD superfamily hydrolase